MSVVLSLPQNMNGFLYILKGKAAVGSDRGEKDQIEAHNTVTLTKVCAVQVPRNIAPLKRVVGRGETRP